MADARASLDMVGRWAVFKAWENTIAPIRSGKEMVKWQTEECLAWM